MFVCILSICMDSGEVLRGKVCVCVCVKDRYKKRSMEENKRRELED